MSEKLIRISTTDSSSSHSPTSVMMKPPSPPPCPSRESHDLTSPITRSARPPVAQIPRRMRDTEVLEREQQPDDDD